MPKQVTITPEVRDVLSRSVVTGAEQRPVLMLPPGQMARSLYEATDKVLKALGGKWDRKARGHVFDRPVEGQLAEALRAGVALDEARTAEQFFTPVLVARLMAEMAEISDGTHVLEPSAGNGRLARAAIERGGSVTAIEKDERLMAALLDVADLRPGWMWRICADFLEWEPPTSPQTNGESWFHWPPDVVLMNPPFSRGQDMAHVTRALQILRPGGKLVAIMSPHWRFATSTKAGEFAQTMRPHDYRWEALPPSTFRESGTDVNTGILSITKSL